MPATLTKTTGSPEKSHTGLSAGLLIMIGAAQNLQCATMRVETLAKKLDFEHDCGETADTKRDTKGVKRSIVR